ncbi:hypothetical protein [Planomonospora parontospora]|uniref:hypothetical protein n=1 Tax=Planomonospora parontospora TaxID=58119 RepID=UPI0016701A06|nr:hypothetical protein [Planomonospora parontospora]GGL56096.1 hypothetical protein GCM10014719_66780 [Planomonospora parontospora subsp. antibiotica]GII19145.1 hypothetical protein Ppa05_58710 [Planomonospora parontospora subsp. antibiotica]
MSQDKYVTSSCISNIQRNLDDKVLPALRDLREDIDSTDVGFPGFGVLGVVFGGKYSDVQEDVRKMTDDAVSTVEAWVIALETIKRNWRAAEESSAVVYR